MKLTLVRQPFANSSYAEFRDNPKNGLVTNGRTDGRMLSPHTAFLFLLRQ
jgi:hypothetical protein